VASTVKPFVALSFEPWIVPPTMAASWPARGYTRTRLTGSSCQHPASTVTAACPLTPEAVATTVNEPALAGAVYSPLEVIVPPAAPSRTDQTTVGETLPVTDAAKDVLALGASVTAAGETVTPGAWAALGTSGAVVAAQLRSSSDIAAPQRTSLLVRSVM